MASVPGASPFHRSDGSDEHGRSLDIVVLIGPDGRVYLRDITPEFVPIALALNPHDPAMRQRLALAAEFSQEGPR